MKLSQGNQPWKAIYCLSHLYEILEKAELWWQRPHWWSGGVGIGVWELFEVVKNANHDKNPWILHLKLLNFIVCKLHPNGVDLKNKECPRKRSTSATASLYPNQWPLSGAMSPAAMLSGAGDRAGRTVVPPPSWMIPISQWNVFATFYKSWFPEGRHFWIPIWGHYESPMKIQAVTVTQVFQGPGTKKAAGKERGAELASGNWRIFGKNEAVASHGEGKSVFVVQRSHSCSYAQLLNWKRLISNLQKSCNSENTQDGFLPASIESNLPNWCPVTP